MKRLAQSLSRAITRLEELCLTFGILAIALLTIANVLGRSLFGHSLASAQELCQFLMIAVTFLGIGYGASEARHIRMTALYDALPRRVRKLVMQLIALSTAALLFVLTWLALRYVFGTVRALGSVSPVLEVPLYLVYLAAPVGFALGAVQYLLTFVRNLGTEEVYVSFTHTDDYEEPVAGV